MIVYKSRRFAVRRYQYGGGGGGGEITEVTKIKPIKYFRQLRRAVTSSVQFKYTRRHEMETFQYLVADV